ncbi:hypothetical protein acdb102_21520 [Acidothermaceae bacterium B102]|nr:hypothetical protein acdb102_21520 [Acidothermaceae bacterium B102]
MRFDHRFVEGAPATLEPGVLYVSIQHRSVLHLCACGCGYEVVTPLAPHRWQLLFDGETVSLEPSVGNSGLPCRSHYFITNNDVDWRRPMTDTAIEWARKRDQRAVDAAFDPSSQGRFKSKSIDPAFDSADAPLLRGAANEVDEVSPQKTARKIASRGSGWFGRRGHRGR